MDKNINRHCWALLIKKEKTSCVVFWGWHSKRSMLHFNRVVLVCQKEVGINGVGRDRGGVYPSVD